MGTGGRIKIVVVTSNAYADLVAEMAARFVKYWPGEFQADVLCYDKAPERLPDRFRTVSLGKEPPGKEWSTPMLGYFLDLWQAKTDGYFALFLDDYYLDKPVNPDFLSTAEWIMRNKEVVKIDLTKDRGQFKHEILVPPWIISAQDAPYRMSLQAAIWRAGYFLSNLKPRLTPWEFELRGNRECMFDGAEIWGTMSGIVSYLNVVKKGKRCIPTT